MPPAVPMPSFPDSPEEAREELARLLRAREGIEEDLGWPSGCSDLQLIESLLKHDSPFALLRSLGFDSETSSIASRLLKESALTPNVRNLARSIEQRLTPTKVPSPAKTPVRKKDMEDVPDGVFDWRKAVLDGRSPLMKKTPSSPSQARAAGFEVGQTVRAAFSEGGLRMFGVVTRAEPLEVRPDGMAESFQFALVEADDSAPDQQASDGSSAEDDLRALEMAKQCIQQGMPQLAKAYLGMVSLAAPPAGSGARAPEPPGTSAERAPAALGAAGEEGAARGAAAGAEAAPRRGGRALEERDRRAAGAGAECGGGHAADAGAQCAAQRGSRQRPRASPGPAFAVGQGVRFADHEADEWKRGVVSSVDPLLVRPDGGYEEGFVFNLVEPLEPAPSRRSEAASGGAQGPRSQGGGACLLEGAGGRAAQDAAAPRAGGGAEGLVASAGRAGSSTGGAAAASMLPWHDLARSLETSTLSICPLGLLRAVDPARAAHALLQSPREEDKSAGSAWLACCFAR